MRPIFIDFETLSPVDIWAEGARAYLTDPRARVLCFVAKLPDGELLAWHPAMPLPEGLFDLVRAGAVLCGHNARKFDAVAWDAQGWPPATWVDTREMARERGIELSLGPLADLLGVAHQKDVDARGLVIALNDAFRDSLLEPKQPPEVSGADLAAIIAYCTKDVECLADVYDALLKRPIVAAQPE